MIPDNELNKVFRIFRSQLEKIYKYHPPTNEQMKKWGLKNRIYIYTRRK